MLVQHQTYMGAIEAHVAAYGKPDVVSLSDDTHIFHYELNGTWKDGQILLVNRNGNHFRLIKQSDGKWLFAKYWRKLFETEAWEVEANLRRADPEELIRLCGVGPQKRGAATELLCLFPKGSTKFTKAVWRGQVLDVRFDKTDDTFRLSFASGNGLVQSYSFPGKIWESEAAARWCKANIGAPHIPIASKAEVMHKDAEVMKELEGSSLWGMF